MEWRKGERGKDRGNEMSQQKRERRELFGVHGLAGRRSELYYFPSRAYMLSMVTTGDSQDLFAGCNKE